MDVQKQNRSIQGGNKRKGSETSRRVWERLVFTLKKGSLLGTLEFSGSRLRSLYLVPSISRIPSSRFGYVPELLYITAR